MNKLIVVLVVAFLAACSASPEYTASSPVVLVQPTVETWIRREGFEGEAAQAVRECSEERRELAGSGLTLSEKSRISLQCMWEKGFRHRNRKYDENGPVF